MVLFQVLSTLWALLNRKRRIIFCALVGLLLVAGIAEMGGMIVIFGFIHGLEAEPDGSRTGPLARLLQLVTLDHLTQLQYAWLAGSAVLCFILFKNGVSALVEFSLTRFLMKLNHRISRKLVDGYLLAPFSTHLVRGPQGIQREITRLYSVFARCFAASAQVLADVTTLLVVAVMLLFVDPLLTISAAIAFGGLGAFTYLVLQKRIRHYGRLEKDSQKEAGRELSDALGGIIDTRLRAASKHFSSRYSRELSKENLYRRRLIGMQRIPRATNEITLTAMIVGSVLYLTYNDRSIADALPTLALFGFAGIRMTGIMTRLSRHLQVLRHQAEPFENYRRRIYRIAPHVLENGVQSPLASYLSAATKQTGVPQVNRRFTLVFEGVHYRFPKSVRFAVRDVSFAIESGQFVSFCGPSGSGKSTLLLLIMGLIEPTSGSATFCSQSLQTVLPQWHRMLGYVGQEQFIASGNVRSNVAFGEPAENVNDERVWAALRTARAEEFVKQLPKNLDQPLASGSKLSGGERQRLAIARALYRDPQVLILDEATAALDNTTERLISDAISGLSGNKTLVCVAHRLSTIQHSDVIHYVEDGSIVASGSYNELRARCPAFARMVDAPSNSAHQRSRD